VLVGIREALELAAARRGSLRARAEFGVAALCVGELGVAALDITAFDVTEVDVTELGVAALCVTERGRAPSRAAPSEALGRVVDSCARPSMGKAWLDTGASKRVLSGAPSEGSERRDSVYEGSVRCPHSGRVCARGPPGDAGEDELPWMRVPPRFTGRCDSLPNAGSVEGTSPDSAEDA